MKTLVPKLPVRVLICPDKFKGTLGAIQAAEAIAEGWRRTRPDDRLELHPISDGGDGFGELLARHLGAEERTVETVDAAHRPIRAVWWWVPKRRTAIIESARVIGLAMLPAGRYHPFELDTWGLGLVLLEAWKLKPLHTLIGIGGSATNDAGFGLARALGWTFLDEQGRTLDRWTELRRLHRIVGFSRKPHPGRVTIAVDVRNPLLGRRGATRIYGPQKGLRPEDLPMAEKALGRVVKVLDEQSRFQADLAGREGAGAAGGLGFGLSAFVGGPLEPGFELFARMTGLIEKLSPADLIITGEGAIDETTVSMGKGVGEIGRKCRRLRRPCWALGGVVANADRARKVFTQVHAMAPDLTSPETARRHAAKWLAELAFRTARAWTR